MAAFWEEGVWGASSAFYFMGKVGATKGTLTVPPPSLAMGKFWLYPRLL